MLRNWSKGEYEYANANANNTEYDLQKILQRLGYQTDDHEDVLLGSATPIVRDGGRTSRSPWWTISVLRCPERMSPETGPTERRGLAVALRVVPETARFPKTG